MSSHPPLFNLMLTRLCFIRHGETAWNAERRLQGHTDIPLNSTGLHQAAATAANLQGEEFSALYCSDLQRARVTAHAIEQRLKLTAQTDSRLRERNFGQLQGLTHEEALEQYPELQPAIRARQIDIVPPSGESLREFAHKVESCLTEIVQAHPNQTVLIVAHGGVLDIAYRLATGMALHAPRDFPIGNATLNWLGFDSNNWHMLAWDVREHLENSCDELPL